ncbi:MAG: hypothetical protein KME26_25315 [Oscillatoria princeps RMCB-10]|jgi:hypothetical protein|nr:hypothetical protein [Oscillatoria princeps RMCB-10]
MIQSETATQLNLILQQDADSVLAWLKNIFSADSSPPEGFNWLGLAEAAAFNAHEGKRHDSTAPDIKWAEVATTVYDRLAALADKAKPGSGESFTISSMTLRAAMIRKLGGVPGDAVLDINRLLQWFWDKLKWSREEVEKKAANWRALNIEEIRELRQLKNRLKVISALADSDKFVLEPEIKAWLSLREKLP